jgi:hypothetical protein
VNFVGGWLGEGCVDAAAVNRSTFVAAAGSTRTSLWLYAQHDSFYSIAHSQANFDAFVAAGGKGIFRIYSRGDPTTNGHFLINEPALWQSDLLEYLAQLPAR